MPKLILAANRLPVTVERKNGKLVYRKSVGGLATGMSSLSGKFDCLWAGFSGVASDDLTSGEFSELQATLKAGYKAIAVELTHTEVKQYYEGFSNETLWPLFHYFPLFTHFDSTNWGSYQDVNRKFAEAVISVYEEGDLIWVQDYQLCLVPAILREKLPQARIGFFLHIPFPAYELFRLLPWRTEILEGLLGADLIGFHTPSYVQHFLDSTRRIAGIENRFGEIRLDNRILMVEAFPMGIDYQKFEQSSEHPLVKKYIKEYSAGLSRYRVLLSVDRLDYTKGLLERLKCFKLFLELFPEYRRKVVWVVIAVPSRTNVEAYEQLNSRVNEQVGHINGTFGDINWTPVHYINRGLSNDEICALYSMAEVALVTPLRDGMNLVAKEYVAARKTGDGVLLLSEMAGVAEELGEAMIVNPHNRQLVARKIDEALRLSFLERRQTMQIMKEKLKKYDVFWWSEAFTTKLQTMGKKIDYPVADFEKERQVLVRNSYRTATKRLFLLDYDGTLVSFRGKPQSRQIHSRKPDFLKDVLNSLNIFDQIGAFTEQKQLIQLLKRVTQDRRNHVYIISGRNKDFLESRFKDLNISLIAEHGGWEKVSGASGWTSYSENRQDWKSYIRPILELYLDRTPGALIEEKDFSLVWHYRLADQKLIDTRVRDLKSQLINSMANMNLKVMDGNMVLEVKQADIDKGRAVSRIMQNGKYDFILAMGDDETDENMFEEIDGAGISVKIGRGFTKAQYTMPDYLSVREFLKFLTVDE